MFLSGVELNGNGTVCKLFLLNFRVFPGGNQENQKISETHCHRKH